ncbi:MAG TPA: polysaccharide deacetylase family protein [Patescibacteria group bacterium]
MEAPTLTQEIVTRIRRTVYSVLGLISKQAPIVVYCYHSISSDNWRFSVSEEILKQQVDFLMSGAKPISMEDLADYLDGQNKIHEPSFILAFDDGYQDLLSVKDYLPFLGIKPTVFVLANPERIDRTQISTNKSFLTNEEILSLHKAGWDIGCHGATHADLTKLSHNQLEAEIIKAKQLLETILNIPIKYFAYPKGKYTPKIIEIVKKAGFKLAFSMDYRIITPQSDQFSIPRVGVDHSHTFREFKGISSPATIRMKKLGARLLPEGIYD